MKTREPGTGTAAARWGAERTGSVLLLTTALLLLAASPARAAASALVEWDAPEACPGAAVVFERLSASLGYEPHTLGKLSRVRGDVVPSAHGYRLSLEVYEGGRRSSRSLEAPSCEDLVDAAVLAITLALAPQGALPEATLTSTAPSAASATPTDDPVAGTPVAAPPVAATAQGAAGAARGIATVGIVTELGALPHPALGVAVSAGAHWLAWSAEAYGLLFGGQRLAARPGQYVEFELSVAGLRGCHRWRPAPITLDSCLGLEVGRWEAFGVELQAAQRARDLWLAPTLAQAGSLALTDALALELRAEAALPLTRKRYIINENELVHTPDVVSWRLLLALAIGTR